VGCEHSVYIHIDYIYSTICIKSGEGRRRKVEGGCGMIGVESGKRLIELGWSKDI